MRLFYLAGYVAGSVVRAVLVRPSDVNEVLRAERDRLEALADRLATANTELARTVHELTTLDDDTWEAAKAAHPASSGGPSDADLAELKDVETVGDILYIHGERWAS